MQEKKVIVLGGKQTFLVRVLIKKLDENKIPCQYIDWNINDISTVRSEAAFYVLYMGEGGVPADEVLHYMNDVISEDSGVLVVIGEDTDIAYLGGKILEGLIYKSFKRPVDNEAFVTMAGILYQKTMECGNKKSILVVDDDPSYLSLVREWLKDDYKVYMAASGMNAIKFLGKNKVDLILLDHEMPVTDGPKVLEMLRNDPETKDIPVMFLTGKSDRDSVVAVLSLKPEGYILKTVLKYELLGTLKDFFAKKG
ncbi:MAG: response regulator [Lachnospiraceae bacterium]|nr:response regulator [Lachnospiraceae bacterium]